MTKLIENPILSQIYHKAKYSNPKDLGYIVSEDLEDAIRAVRLHFKKVQKVDPAPQDTKLFAEFFRVDKTKLRRIGTMEYDKVFVAD